MIIYTSAPEAYDDFGTKTITVVGITKQNKSLRKVEIIDEHIHWQRARYLSGLYEALTEKDLELLREFILKGAE